MIQRQKFRTKQARKRERVRLALKATTILAVFLIFFGLLAYGSHSASLRIRDVYVQTDGSLSSEELASVIKAQLDGKYFGVWPKDSIVSVSDSLITDTLESEFPRISTATVKRTGVYSLTASVEERKPDALWCGDVVPPVAYTRLNLEEPHSNDAWGTCYMLDAEGYIYARAPLFSGNMFPRYYGSLQHGEPVAQQYIPKEEFVRWQNFYRELSVTENTAPQALLFVDERDIELYLTSGLRILVPREDDTEAVRRRLFALFEAENMNEKENVEYIDLRFGNKAFVKYLQTDS